MSGVSGNFQFNELFLHNNLYANNWGGKKPVYIISANFDTDGDAYGAYFTESMLKLASYEAGHICREARRAQISILPQLCYEIQRKQLNLIAFHDRITRYGLRCPVNIAASIIRRTSYNG